MVRNRAILFLHYKDNFETNRIFALPPDYLVFSLEGTKNLRCCTQCSTKEYFDGEALSSYSMLAFSALYLENDHTIFTELQ